MHPTRLSHVPISRQKGRLNCLRGAGRRRQRRRRQRRRPQAGIATVLRADNACNRLYKLCAPAYLSNSSSSESIASAAISPCGKPPSVSVPFTRQVLSTANAGRNVRTNRTGTPLSLRAQRGTVVAGFAARCQLCTDLCESMGEPVVDQAIDRIMQTWHLYRTRGWRHQGGWSPCWLPACTSDVIMHGLPASRLGQQPR